MESMEQVSEVSERNVLYDPLVQYPELLVKVEGTSSLAVVALVLVELGCMHHSALLVPESSGFAIRCGAALLLRAVASGSFVHLYVPHVPGIVVSLLFFGIFCWQERFGATSSNQRLRGVCNVRC